ncbi:MAG: ribose 5-phosphate isomerase B [Planctomycetota bacterium]|nr:MAG: ribose 5-phosphate isomerase B [Planctomycetota bacterium]
MKIAIASDHAGFDMKLLAINIIKDLGFEIIDLGPTTNNSVDYPDYGKLVAKGVSNGAYDKGILICGTGLGMSYVANKYESVLAALCTNEFMAKMARAHNNANILVLGARVLGDDLATSIINVFFNTPFSNEERHNRRLNKILDLKKN